MTAVVYYHGGGWISGSSDISTYRLLDVAAEGHPVFNVEYPLAPEYRIRTSCVRPLPR
jgi:acetyl esterase/lipase